MQLADHVVGVCSWSLRCHSIPETVKAVKELEDVHLAQAINYLEAYGMDIGLLINFGNTSLQFKRVMKPRV